MAYDVQSKIADAERAAGSAGADPASAAWALKATRVMCPVHPGRGWTKNYAGIFVCPDSSHAPHRGDDE